MPGFFVKMAVLAAFLLPMLAGCTGTLDAQDDESPSDHSYPIRLINKDAGMARSDAPLENTWTNFHAVAVKQIPGEADVQTVFPGYKVTYDGAAWSYESDELGQYLKYWDLRAESYLFSGVAPAPNNNPSAGEAYRDTEVEITTDGEIKIHNVFGNVSTGTYANSSNSPDWMIAQTRRVAFPLADTDMREPGADLHPEGQALTVLTDPVPLRFHHVMARAEFLVFATSTIILERFRVDVADGQRIIDHADYSSVDGWTDKHSSEGDNSLRFCTYQYLDGRVLSTDQNSPSLLASHVQIPQTWADTGRKFNLTFTAKDGTVYQGTITLDAKTNNTNSWRENYRYRYVIKIDTEGHDVEVILFAVDMDTWKWKPGSSHQDTQTDW